MRAQPSDLAVVTAAKTLCEYTLTITQSSPKRFRFTFVTRLQNLALGVVEEIYRANDVFIGKDCSPGSPRMRLDYQQEALTDARLLAYLAEVAYRQNCLLRKQFELITKHSAACQRLLGAWINSDKKRLAAEQGASTATVSVASEGI
jgi:hypothetical protein